MKATLHVPPTFLLLVIMIVGAGMAQAAAAAAAAAARPASRPLIIAHRGASGHAPENTMAAFELAIELGADAVELDVRRSLDGALVVIHDATVNRTTTGEHRGFVSRLTLAQLKTLDAGSWRGTQYAGERIPTLEEVFVGLRGRTRFLIELKDSGIEEDVVRVIREAGVADSVMLQSFSAKSVAVIASLIPEAPSGVLFRRPILFGRGRFTDKVVHTTADKGAVFAAVAHKAMTKSQVDAVSAQGLGIYAWTVNDVDAMRKMIDLGVDGIITNYPDIVRGLM